METKQLVRQLIHAAGNENAKATTHCLSQRCKNKARIDSIANTFAIQTSKSSLKKRSLYECTRPSNAKRRSQNSSV